MALKETIAAISTPPGTGGIGIIRVSGPEAEKIARTIFRPRKTIRWESHKLYHGDLISPEGNVLDEVLAVIMKAPRSYTGEDTFEIHCHGGLLIQENILRAVLRTGARAAEPGEFTKRAYLNNRLDLSQAEAVMDIILAKSDKALSIAVAHLKGSLVQKTRGLRETLVGIIADVEASIDFVEDDIETHAPRETAALIGDLQKEIRNLLSTYETGKLYREGIEVVIAGRPNTGKSSLLNCLLGEERAIVTPTPGTTRDFIEQSISINGVPVKLIDTAGIRYSDDFIEQEGMRKLREKVEKAGLAILLFDGSEPLAAEDISAVEALRGKNIIPVLNKADLPDQLELAEIRKHLPRLRALRVSAKFGTGMDKLKERIVEAVSGQAVSEQVAGAFVSNVRQKAALENTDRRLDQAKEAIGQKMPPEVTAVELRDALRELGEITGETLNEEILDRIFSEFCVGK